MSEATQMPSNIDAERAILSAVFLDNRVIRKLRGRLSVEEFYLSAHKYIYAGMLELTDAKREIDLITMTENLTKSGKLAAANGASYLAARPSMGNSAFKGNILEALGKGVSVAVFRVRLDEIPTEKRSMSILLGVAKREIENLGLGQW